MSNELLDYALKYASINWKVFPVHTIENGKCTCSYGDKCVAKGKHPKIKGWQQTASTDENQIKSWWKKWPNANIGIVTGAPSGIVVIDVDAKNNGLDTLLELETTHGKLPNTPQDITGGGGKHIVFKHPGQRVINNQAGKIGIGIDIRGDGGLIVAPPSLHHSGKFYYWDDVCTPWNTELSPMPDWLLQIVVINNNPPQPIPLNEVKGNLDNSPKTHTDPTEITKNASDILKKALDKIAHGDHRNETGFWLACQLRDNNFDYHTAESILIDYARMTPEKDHPYTPREAVESTKSAYNRAPRLPSHRNGNGKNGSVTLVTPTEHQQEKEEFLPYKDVEEAMEEGEFGDATLLSKLYAGRLIYDHSEKKWFRFTGSYWERDRTEEIRVIIPTKVASQYANLYAAKLRKAETNEDQNAAKALIERARSLKFKKRIDSIAGIATTLKNMKLAGDEWDLDPWLLGCSNGVIDLHTGDFRPGEPKDFIQLAAPTAWRGISKEATRWEQFVSEIFEEDTEVIDFVQRILGYSITGLSIEHLLVILYGEEGRNGKDTLLDAISRVLGPLSKPVQSEVLLDSQKNPNAASPHLFSLRGLRIAWVNESAEGQKLNSSQVKMLTGGGKITARPLYGSPITFDPQHQLFLMTNFKPHASIDDNALWDRLVVIPFTQRYVDEPTEPNEHLKDKYLIEKLTYEKSGILAWLVRGCLAWQERGLYPFPRKIAETIEAYYNEEDTIGNFLEECCVEDDTSEIKASVLYSYYKDWAGHKSAMSNTTFGRKMGKRITRIEKSDGKYYQGIRMRAIKEISLNADSL